MLVGFFVTLFGGLPIGFALALAALIFIWVEGTLPGVIFAQQMARGIDNFVLLAIPFFILVGYLMEANGMSVRLIELLQRAVGHMRGGLNVVMVAVDGDVLRHLRLEDGRRRGGRLGADPGGAPLAAKSGQRGGAAGGFRGDGGDHSALHQPDHPRLRRQSLDRRAVHGRHVAGRIDGAGADRGVHHLRRQGRGGCDASCATAVSGLWSGAIASFGLIFMIFAGFKSGFATATEISAFAALYALVVGAVVFRELGWKSAAQSFVHAATRSGLVLFIVAAAQSLAFILTLQQVPHVVGDMMLALSKTNGVWLFLLLSIAMLIVMGSVLEGAAALIIFGPLLLPVAVKLGIDPLHFGVVLVIAMGIGLFAPPLGLGLYGACLIGEVPIEQTVKPILGYLGLLFLCLLVIAFVPAISTASAARLRILTET